MKIQNSNEGFQKILPSKNSAFYLQKLADHFLKLPLKIIQFSLVQDLKYISYLDLFVNRKSIEYCEFIARHDSNRRVGHFP